jgi:hypothetical protein
MQRAAGQPGRLRLSFQVVFFFSNNSFLYPSYLRAPASCGQITINSGSAGILPANYYQFWERRHPAGKLLSILGAPASCRQITINSCHHPGGTPI